MRNYHVVLADGSERNVKAKDLEVRDGVLTFSNEDEIVCVYASGAWTMVEVERLDDKG